MFGAHSLKKLLEDYPVAALFLGIAIVLPFAIRIARQFQQNRVRAKEARRRIIDARDAMLKCFEYQDFYDAFGGYLHAVHHQMDAAEYQELALIVKATGNVDIAFDTEGLDWVLAHWDSGDFDTMVDGAKLLGLEHITKPIRDAQAQFHEKNLLYKSVRSDAEYKQLYASEAYKQFKVNLGSIEAEFAALGGATLFHETANKLLREKMNDMLAG